MRYKVPIYYYYCVYILLYDTAHFPSWAWLFSFTHHRNGCKGRNKECVYKVVYYILIEKTCPRCLYIFFLIFIYSIYVLHKNWSTFFSLVNNGKFIPLTPLLAWQIRLQFNSRKNDVIKYFSFYLFFICTANLYELESATRTVWKALWSWVEWCHYEHLLTKYDDFIMLSFECESVCIILWAWSYLNFNCTHCRIKFQKLESSQFSRSLREMSLTEHSPPKNKSKRQQVYGFWTLNYSRATVAFDGEFDGNGF